METELIVVVLSVTLPIYPALFVIYQKIGKYDEVCEEFRRLREEHERFHHGDTSHGPPDNPDHRDDRGRRHGARRILAANTED